MKYISVLHSRHPPLLIKCLRNKKRQKQRGFENWPVMKHSQTGVAFIEKGQFPRHIEIIVFFFSVYSFLLLFSYLLQLRKNSIEHLKSSQPAAPNEKLQECRKTKTKVITLTNHKNVNNTKDQQDSKQIHVPGAKRGKSVRARHDWFWVLLLIG